MKVGVIGAGTMGSGIVQMLAVTGFDAVMNDISSEALDRGVAGIDKGLAKLVSKGKMEASAKDAAMARIQKASDMSKLSDCDVVIEAATENMVLKKKIFEQLDGVARPDAILATNTSSLSITEIAAATKRPDQVVGMHFFNPVPVMKLVEVIRGMTTSTKTYDVVTDLALKMGKTPVAVEEAPGFVVNRILVPMINEAVGLLAEGVASAEDIDRAMCLGANHPIGPLALADLIGNDVCLAVMDVLYTEFSDSKYRSHPLLRKMVRAGHLGRKTGRGFYTY